MTHASRSSGFMSLPCSSETAYLSSRILLVRNLAVLTVCARCEDRERTQSQPWIRGLRGIG